MTITRDTQIEELIKAYPDAVGFLIRHGLPCVVCGEPFWGTIAALAEQKGWNSGRIDDLVNEFNASHN